MARLVIKPGVYSTIFPLEGNQECRGKSTILSCPAQLEFIEEQNNVIRAEFCNCDSKFYISSVVLR